MGACYSKAGHDFSIISRHKAPKDKNKNPSNGNGKPSGVKKERIRNGSLTLNFPVSCSNGVKEQTDTRDSDSDVCSLCKLGGNEDRDSDVCSLCKLGGNEDRDSESRVSSPHGEDNVVTSDSGIGSFLPPEESLEPIETAITPVDEIDSKTDCELSDDTVWKLRTDITNGESYSGTDITNGESYLSSPCGNDRAKWLHKAEVKRGEGCVVEECEGVEDSDSGAENKCSGKSVDLENGNRDSYTPTLEPSDISLTDLRHCDSETSLDLQLPSILPHLSEIRTMKLDGQDVVVIDVESFTQIMDEVSLLKQKLSQLTSVILEEGSLSCRSSLSGIASH
ncbi:hypothetical protein ScPMuIL_004554 [Solemya velum]